VIYIQTVQGLLKLMVDYVETDEEMKKRVQASVVEIKAEHREFEESSTIKGVGRR